MDKPDKENKVNPVYFINLRMIALLNAVSFVTALNAVLGIAKVSLYFPMGLNLGRFLVIQFYNHKVNSLIVYFALTVILAGIFFLMGRLLKRDINRFNKAIFTAVLLIYVIDTLSVIYMGISLQSAILIIDLLFHFIFLYRLFVVAKPIIRLKGSSNEV